MVKVKGRVESTASASATNAGRVTVAATLRRLVTLFILLIAAPGVWAQTANDNSGRDVVDSWSADVSQQVDQKLEDAQRAVQMLEQLRAPIADSASISTVSKWPEAYAAALYTQAQQRGFFPNSIETRSHSLQLSPTLASERLPNPLRHSFAVKMNTPFEAMIRTVLRSEGIPAELIAVPRVESGFNPLALSPKGARGLWQLMPSTARRFGLQINGMLDERIDPVRSTIAAAQYLKELHQRWGDWALALAAYNAGEGRVERALRISGARDFATLAKLRLLPYETELYVPSVLASAEPMQYPGSLLEPLPTRFDWGRVR